jgi:putative ABC transport system permease protein
VKIDNILRALAVRKFYSVINISGLAIGMAGFIMIALWIENQFGFDQFHERRHQIFRVIQNQQDSDGAIQTYNSVPIPLADKIKADYPDALLVARATLGSGGVKTLIGNGKDSYFELGGYADASFFELFSFSFTTAISPKQALSNNSSIIISERFAKKMFSNSDAIGQVLIKDKTEEYKVTAVFKDTPANSSFQFDFVLPFEIYIKNYPYAVSWQYNTIDTYVLLTDPAITNTFEANIKNLVKEQVKVSTVELLLQPFTDWYLYGTFKNGKNNGGRIDTIKLTGLIAILILAMACTNFTNLSTAMASTRAKEVGVRKITGATRQELMSQFLSESIASAFIALAVALCITYFLMPLFNQLFNSHLSLDFSNPSIWIILILTALLTGIVAGGYPAFILSGFVPVKVLKSSWHIPERAWFRKSLVMFQLVLSASLIMLTLLVYHQIEFIKTCDHGFNRENIVRFTARGDVLKNFESYKTEAMRNSIILSMTSTDAVPIGLKSSTSGFSWPGKIEGQDPLINISYVNYDLIETLEMKLTEGRTFSKDFKSDSTAILINEATASRMGLSNPVGMEITSGKYKFQIIGLLKNHHARSLLKDYDPFIFFLSPSSAPIVLAKVQVGKEEEAVQHLKTLYKTFEPEFPFEFTFLEENFMKLYKSEMQMSSLSKWSASLAIIISCLGLFGLSAFSAERKRKEIAIRKTLGAHIFQIMLMLNKEYIKLLGYSILVSIPVCYYMTAEFLTRYAFKVAINEVALLLYTGSFLLTVCIVTVSYYSFKAADTNPAQVLKCE